MPLFKYVKTGENFSYIIWSIIESSSELFMQTKLSVAEKIEHKIITDENRQSQWLAARVAIKYLVEKNGQKYHGVKKNSIGKPFLIKSNNFISISHCKKYAAAVLSEKNDVGTDIQACVDNLFLVKNKFLSCDELLYPGLAVDKLCVMWSAKETIYKMLALKGLSFKKDIIINNFTLQKNGILETSCKGKVFYVQYEIFDSHAFSYALVE